MKNLMENWKRFLKEDIKIVIGKAIDLVCPPATQDLELNTKNRDAAIKAEHIQYGPLNLDDEAYWERSAEHWNTEPSIAKMSRCGNCIAFDISPRMLDCLPGPTSEAIEDADGKLGYCWMHHFKCHSARYCYTWAAGGPISEDTVSAQWQEKNKFPEEPIEEKKKKRKKRRRKRRSKRGYGGGYMFDLGGSGDGGDGGGGE